MALYDKQISISTAILMVTIVTKTHDIRHGKWVSIKKVADRQPFSFML